MDEFIGIIKLFGGNFAPRGWAFCNGQQLPIAQYSAVFSLLGTMYGGDGVQTFGLPDLRSRVPVGMGQGPGLSSYTQGQASGTENVTLTQAQMPAHTHSLLTSTSPATTSAAGNNFLAQTNGVTAISEEAVTVNAYVPALGTPAPTNPAGMTPAGGNQPLPVLQPMLALNYIICLEGVYPSRS